tara:strand:+ start:326 stop:838 length:513 start_codon:yes stop_codon:yes gene_type:complete
MGDSRAKPSEYFAFKHLGLNETHQIKTENELMSEISTVVPEGIFRYPTNDKIISVEVKRIVGNNLPLDDRHEGSKRRFIRRRKHIIWPWASTVEAALQKANECVIGTYFVEEHHMVFVTPQSLSSRMHHRITEHIHNTVKEYLKREYNIIKSNRIHTHIIQGPDSLFDRF